MLGFAVLDCQPKTARAAVWLTSRIGPTSVSHTNAVVVDLAEDASGLQKVHSLTRDRATILTSGSSADGLPLTVRIGSIGDIERWDAACLPHRQRINDAVSTYAKQARSPNLIRPFGTGKLLDHEQASEDSPGARALQTATYLARVWTRWLQTEEERQRRTVNPKTETSPWMMPDGLDDLAIVEVPAEITDFVDAQPREPFSA